MNDLMPLLQDENIFEIYINPDGKVWTDGFRGREFTEIVMSGAQVKQIILNVAALTNQLVTDEKPALDFQSPQPNPQIPPPIQSPLINPPQPVTTNITILGVAGPVQGRTFSDPQRLIIGREPSQCNVVLPPRTPGVSRRHCILERRQGEVYIMDVGSSSGTFFQNGNGQRLPLNQWIKVTDNFYLGSPNVMFSVN